MGKVKKVKPLSEQDALNLGTEILGDLVIVVCFLGIYVFVEARSSKQKEEAEEEKEREMKELKDLVSEQGVVLEIQAARLREMERLLHSKTMYSKTSERVMNEYTHKTDRDKKS